MKRKTSLSLMELAIMVAVFALAAAICLRAFVWADVNSRRSEAESQAALRCQSAAELIKHADGSGADRLAAVAERLGAKQEPDRIWLSYDENWAATDYGTYYLYAHCIDAGQPLLGKAEVVVMQKGGTEEDILFRLEVCWQEVSDDA